MNRNCLWLLTLCGVFCGEHLLQLFDLSKKHVIFLALQVPFESFDLPGHLGRILLGVLKLHAKFNHLDAINCCDLPLIFDQV